jgi:hypothetical protein
VVPAQRAAIKHGMHGQQIFHEARWYPQIVDGSRRAAPRLLRALGLGRNREQSSLG